MIRFLFEGSAGSSYHHREWVSKCHFLQWLWLVGIFPTAMDIAFMSLQCITPTIGLVADQTPDHFVSVSIVSLPSYGCHPSYDHWIIVTTTTTTDTTTTTTSTTTTNHHHHHHHHLHHHHHPQPPPPPPPPIPTTWWTIVS